jgi:hypothetical protein
MAIVVESTTTNIDHESSDVVINKPVGVANDDVLIACITAATDNDDPTYVLPSGWTLAIFNEDLDGPDRCAYIAYKVITNAAGESSTYTFKVEGTHNPDYAIAGSIMRCSGIDTADPLDVTGSGSDDSTEDDVDVSSLTPTNNGALIVHTGSICNNSDQTMNGSYTTPSGYTKVLDENGYGDYWFTTHDFGYDLWMAAFSGYKVQTTAAATGIITWSNSNSNGTDDVHACAAFNAAAGAGIAVGKRIMMVM